MKPPPDLGPKKRGGLKLNRGSIRVRSENIFQTFGLITRSYSSCHHNQKLEKGQMNRREDETEFLTEICSDDVIKSRLEKRIREDQRAMPVVSKIIC